MFCVDFVILTSFFVCYSLTLCVFTEGEAEQFSVGPLDGPFKVGEPFNVPVEFHDEFGHQTKPISNPKPVLECRCVH